MVALPAWPEMYDDHLAAPPREPATGTADGLPSPAAWAGPIEGDEQQLRWLQCLRNQAAAIWVLAPTGAAIGATLRSLDPLQRRLGLGVAAQHPLLDALVDSDEAVAVAWLDGSELRLALQDMVLVRGPRRALLQAAWPSAMHRFPRRTCGRVGSPAAGSPAATLRHPAIADMSLVLRVLDVSLGGCALHLPPDVPVLEPGITLHGVQVQLDARTRFQASLALRHVSSPPAGGPGVRVGCEWGPLDAAAAQTLRRYIDQTRGRRGGAAPAQGRAAGLTPACS